MTPQMDFNDRYQKLLMENNIEFTPSIEWFENALKALKFTSPVGLGIPNGEMRGLRDKLLASKPLSLYEFAVLNTNLERRSPNDLDLPFNDYFDVMDMAGSYTKAWNEETAPLRNMLLQEASGKKGNLTKA